MILQMANGNFNCRIPRSDENSETEAIAALLNMLAQELQASYNPFVFNVPAANIFDVEHYLFVIDQDATILKTNFDIQTELPLINQNFLELLTPQTKKIFLKRLKSIRKKKQYKCTCKLQILSVTGLTISLDCTLFDMEYDPSPGDYLVVGSRIQSHNPLIQKDNAFKKNDPVRKLVVLKSTADIQNIQKLEAYLRENMEAHTESLKTLAKRFGLNEYKLKNGFKELYQTSVFKYQMQQRLYRARHLIYTTNDQLSCIAVKTGFKSYVHFGEAFKKEFGVAPSFYRKNPK